MYKIIINGKNGKTNIYRFENDTGALECLSDDDSWVEIETVDDIGTAVNCAIEHFGNRNIANLEINVVDDE